MTDLHKIDVVEHKMDHNNNGIICFCDFTNNRLNEKFRREMIFKISNKNAVILTLTLELKECIFKYFDNINDKICKFDR